MENPVENQLLSDVATYYSEKLARHGQSPRGVDWNGEEGQILRFRQLCSVIDGAPEFSVNDIGCGYGALYDFLASHHKKFSYVGLDVSSDMIVAARARLPRADQASFVLSAQPDRIADYGIASGIFNVKVGRSETEWRGYMESTLDLIDKSSLRGFAFNCLTLYSDAEKMQPHLHYADPCVLFDLCKRRYSRNVALLHDYGLYEFTIIVRKHS